MEFILRLDIPLGGIEGGVPSFSSSALSSVSFEIILWYGGGGGLSAEKKI